MRCCYNGSGDERFFPLFCSSPHMFLCQNTTGMRIGTWNKFSSGYDTNQTASNSLTKPAAYRVCKHRLQAAHKHKLGNMSVDVCQRGLCHDNLRAWNPTPCKNMFVVLASIAWCQQSAKTNLYLCLLFTRNYPHLHSNFLFHLIKHKYKILHKNAQPPFRPLTDCLYFYINMNIQYLYW